MNAIESGLLTKLRELDQSIKDMASKGSKPDLMGFFNDIDQLTSELPRGSDPELLHFLHKKSYEKALYHLEGKGAINKKGTCH